MDTRDKEEDATVDEIRKEIQKFYEEKWTYTAPEELVAAIKAVIQIVHDRVERGTASTYPTISVTKTHVCMTLRDTEIILFVNEGRVAAYARYGTHPQMDLSGFSLDHMAIIAEELTDVASKMMDRLEEADEMCNKAIQICNDLADSTMTAVRKTFPAEILDTFTETKEGETF